AVQAERIILRCHSVVELLLEGVLLLLQIAHGSLRRFQLLLQLFEGHLQRRQIRGRCCSELYLDIKLSPQCFYAMSDMKASSALPLVRCALARSAWSTDCICA